MKYIEVKEYQDGTTVLIPLDKIQMITTAPNGRRITYIFLTKGSREFISTEMSYQEVKDLIAATYGAEDEED